jgi:uncharacterized protein
MKVQTIKNKEFRKLVSKICREIDQSGWRPDYIVGITRGGLTPAVLISQYFSATMHTLKVNLRDGKDCESNLWMSEDAYGFGGELKNILIVDDINDSGATLNWIMDDWQKSCMPTDAKWSQVWNNNVKFAVIVDNLSSECLAKMDFCGIEINKAEEDVWVEFPWEGWWKK